MRSANWPVSEAARLVVILWGSLAAIQPLLSKGLQGGTLDAIIHLYRLYDLDLAIRSGQLLPRVAPNLALGYGYATFTFYPPLGLYLGEIFHLAGLGYIASLKACFASAILLGSVGMYLLARAHFGSLGGMVAGISYAYLPYLLLSTYVRGDLAECLALGILPFVFWSAHRCVQYPRPGTIVATSIAGAALLLTHALTALVIAPILVGYVGVILFSLARAGSSIRSPIRALILSGLLGAALSASYWLPVLSRFGDINHAVLIDGFFDYHRSFIPPAQLVQSTFAYDYRNASESGARFNVGLAQFGVVAFATAWGILVRRADRGLIGLGAIGIATFLWLQQDGSAWVWEHLPALPYLQFPFRLNSGIGLLGAFLLGSVVPTGQAAGAPGRPRPPRVSAAVQSWIQKSVGVLVVGVVVASSIARLPSGHLSLQESQVNLPTLWQKEQAEGQIAGVTRGDYLPPWVQGDLFRLAFTRTSTVGTATARLTADEFNPFYLEGAIQADAPTTLQFDRIYDPVWTATIDGHPIAVGPSGSLGQVTIAIPAGPHRIRLSTAETPAGSVGLALAALGLVIVAVVFIGPRRARWPGRLVILLVFISSLIIGVSQTIRYPIPIRSTGIDFGGKIWLVGAALAPSPTPPTGIIQVDLLWQALEAPLPACTVHLRLLDPGGRVVARRDKAPLFGIRACFGWSARTVVHDLQQIRLPPGATAGPYRLALGISLNDQFLAPTPGSDFTGSLVTWSEPGANHAVPGLLLGEVIIPSVPPAATLSGGQAINATFDHHFALEAIQIRPASSDSRFIARLSPGERITIDALWRSLADTSANYAVFLQLLDARGQLVSQFDAWPSHWNFPTAVWFPGDTLIDHYELIPPETLRPGVYRLVTGLYLPETMERLPVVRGGQREGDQVVLGVIKVASADQAFGLAVDAISRDIPFDSQIALVAGAPRDVEVSAGTEVTVVLIWRALTKPKANYTVFAHILDDQGKLVAQHDAPPGEGTFATEYWDPGDTISDLVTIPLGASLPAGRYAIEVGLYEPTSGARLAAPDGATSTIIGNFTIR